MTSVITIINNAFINLGKPPVIDAQSPDTNPQFAAAVDVYNLVIDSVLSEFPWRFAMKTQELSVLVAPPIIDRWSTQAQLPADLLTIYRLEPLVNYEVFQDKIYYMGTNNLKMDYIFRPLESEFPAYFVDMIVLVLTSRIAMNITQNPSIAQYWDNKAEKAKVIAKHVDSTIQPQQPPVRDGLISAHYGAGLRGTYRGPY